MMLKNNPILVGTQRVYPFGTFGNKIILNPTLVESLMIMDLLYQKHIFL